MSSRVPVFDDRLRLGGLLQRPLSKSIDKRCDLFRVFYIRTLNLWILTLFILRFIDASVAGWLILTAS